MSLTPRPGGDRREEVYAACELLQALGLRVVFAERHRVSGLRPHDQHDVPGARRTDPGLHPREDARRGRREYDGVETMTLAVMGCVVNGPGESKAANIGISLPGTGEAPNCPIFIDGEHVDDAARHLRRAGRRVSAARRRLRGAHLRSTLTDTGRGHERDRTRF